MATRKRRLAALAAIVAGVTGLCAYFEVAAREGAQAFCGRALEGSPVAPLATDAASTGERQLRRISSERVQIGFTGIPPFSRYICTIEVQDGRVRGARVSHID